MREILFRAKGQTSDKWHEGLLTRLDQDVCHIKDNRHNEWICDPQTVCQYTGLTDKNGRKIFEGDIVRYANIGALGKVVWYEGDYIGYAIDDIEDSFQQYEKELFEKTEVIGNIFDNPELLR